MKTNTLTSKIFLSVLAATIVGADERQYDPSPEDIAVYQAKYPDLILHDAEILATRAIPLAAVPQYIPSPEEIAAYELSVRDEMSLAPRVPFLPGPPISSACLACISGHMLLTTGINWVYRITRMRGSTQISGFAAALSTCGLGFGDPCWDLANAPDEDGNMIGQSEARWVGHCTAQNGLIVP